MSQDPPYYYYVGGALNSEHKSYVERGADTELAHMALNGELCYILTARQMGKSSLMFRTANKLIDQKVLV